MRRCTLVRACAAGAAAAVLAGCSAADPAPAGPARAAAPPAAPPAKPPAAAYPAAPAPAAPVFTAGSAGRGDRYFPRDGNGGYDVQHYALDIDHRASTGRLTGVATVYARATKNLSRFNLDLVGLKVRGVSVDGRRAGFRRTDHELTVTPSAGLLAGALFTTVVRYDGVPEPVRRYTPFGSGSGFLRTDDGFVIAGQPHVAATWFPVNDHPADRASYTFRITVPEGRTAVANGILLGRTTAGDRTTWTWQATEPMSSYLATVVAGRFTLTSYVRNGIRYWDALEAGLTGQPAANAAVALGRQGEILDWLSAQFGPYPFSSAGSVVHGLGLGFALENQTRSVYPVRLFKDRRHGISLFVHEMAHQWFGDSLALARWRHMWLNEGLATYAQWLWAEREGYATPDALFAKAYARPKGSDFWQVVIGDPGPGRLFSDPVYERGAMALHELRRVVGDPAFFALLRRWPAENHGSTVTTRQFVDLAERVSGRELDPFFDRWVRSAGKPALAVG